MKFGLKAVEMAFMELLKSTEGGPEVALSAFQEENIFVTLITELPGTEFSTLIVLPPKGSRHGIDFSLGNAYNYWCWWINNQIELEKNYYSSFSRELKCFGLDVNKTPFSTIFSNLSFFYRCKMLYPCSLECAIPFSIPTQFRNTLLGAIEKSIPLLSDCLILIDNSTPTIGEEFFKAFREPRSCSRDDHSGIHLKDDNVRESDNNNLKLAIDTLISSNNKDFSISHARVVKLTNKSYGCVVQRTYTDNILPLGDRRLFGEFESIESVRRLNHLRAEALVNCALPHFYLSLTQRDFAYLHLKKNTIELESSDYDKLLYFIEKYPQCFSSERVELKLVNEYLLSMEEQYLNCNSDPFLDILEVPCKVKRPWELAKIKSLRNNIRSQ